MFFIIVVIKESKVESLFVCLLNCKINQNKKRDNIFLFYH